jgi:hypothetical protein
MNFPPMAGAAVLVVRDVRARHALEGGGGLIKLVEVEENLGFGRIVASEPEVQIMLVNMV